jgi:uncharacterized glyoxalase superfamily protein PhnB
MSDERSGVPSPLGLVLYLVYQDVGATTEWLVNTLGFIESGRSVDANGVVRNAELKAGPTVLMLERNDHQPASYPSGTRWTGVWVDDPDDCYRRLLAMDVEAQPPEDEPWGGRLVRVADPEGHIWALIKRI